MNSNHSPSKITNDHLAKVAYVYVRQSTTIQLLRHTESTIRQYELVNRANALGWPAAHVKVIDDDLAKSGAHADLRAGFQQLLAQISLGQVGLVLSLEAARLARNCSDWYRMLELCSIFGTLIADYEVVYDPRLYHDRLLLGLAGMMSEAELHHIRMRMTEGQRHKAERGELRLPLPAGLERLRTGEVVLHPDEEIQARVRLVFNKFRELGSAASVVRYLREHNLKLPARHRRGAEPYDISWVEAKTNGVLNILQNPTYTGAYTWGKSTSDPARRVSDVPHSGIIQLPVDQWKVIRRDVYPAYLSWEEYEINQQRLRANQYRYKEGQQGAPRTGQALLQGIALCGQCGARMWVRYRGARQGLAGYVCNERARELSEPRCQEVSSGDVDSAVERLILKALEPDKIKLALAAYEQLEGESAGLEKQWRLRVERARYEAQRAQRQYDAVEPENRLVARNLEQHWEAKLRAAEQIEREYELWYKQHHVVLTVKDRQEILALGEDLPKIWHAETTTSADRKKIVRLMVRDIILDRKREVGQIWMKINWQTGASTEHWVKRQVCRYRELPEAKQLEERLRELKKSGLRDVEIVMKLGAEGYRASNGGELTKQSIHHLREIWGIESARQERKRTQAQQWEDGTYTLEGAAATLGIHVRTVHVWIKRGMIETKEACKKVALKIVLTEARIAELKEYLGRVRILPRSKRTVSRSM